jgi:phage terminase small subunit
MVDERLRGDTSGDTNVVKKGHGGGAIRHPIKSDGLTDKQRIFVKIYAENEGRLTPTECARQAGYAEDRANTTASELLNGKRFPKVVEAVIARRAEIEKTHEVKLNKHVQELARLREKSLAEKSYSAAVNAERLRGQAAGLYIDRKEIRTGSIDSMSRDDVLRQLKELGLTGEFNKEGNKTVLSVEKESSSEGPKDVTPVGSEDSKGQEKV